MRYLLFLIFIFCGSWSFAASWNKTVPSEYEKAKSYKELFCATSAKSKSCQYYQKNLGSHFLRRPLKVSVGSDDTLLVHTDVSLVKVTRQNENKFLVNGHPVNLGNLNSRDELREFIRKSLPRKTSGRSFWVSSAWAQSGSGLSLELTGVVDLQVIATIDHLLVLSKTLDSCEGLEAFAKVCSDHPEALARALGQSHQSWKSPSPAEKEAQVQVIKEYLHGLNLLAASLEKNKARALNASLKTCSKKNPPLEAIFKECVADIETSAKALKVMKEDMDGQVQQFLDGYTADYEEAEFDGVHAELEYVTPVKKARARSGQR